MLQIQIPWVDTPISGSPAVVELPVAQVNFGADFAYTATGNDGARITNVSTPIGNDQIFRFQSSDIANIYTNSGIDPTYQSPSKRGKSVLVQLNSVLPVRDDTDSSYLVYLPIQTHLVMKVPINAVITEDLVLTHLKRLLAGVFETGDGTTTRLKGLIRGSLLPKDIIS